MNMVGNRFGAEKISKKNENHKFFLDYFLFSPENKVYLAWKMFDTFLCLFSSFFYGYIAAFVDYDIYNSLKPHILSIELCFLITFLTNFFKLFHADGTTSFVRSHYLIAIHYFKGLFIVDLIALVPFEYF